MKSITCSQTAGSVPTVVWFYIDNGTTSPQIYRFALGANDVPEYRDVWIVLEEGDLLRMAQSSGRTIDVHISGTLLVGDPA